MALDGDTLFGTGRVASLDSDENYIWKIEFQDSNYDAEFDLNTCRSFEIIYGYSGYTRLVQGIRQELDTDSGEKMIHFTLYELESHELYYHKWSLESANNGFVYQIADGLDSSLYFTQTAFRSDRTQTNDGSNVLYEAFIVGGTRFPGG